MKFVRYHRNAQFELHDSAEYYEHQQAGLGDRFFTEYESALDLIVSHPYAGNSFELDTRRVMISGFPYYIVYKVFPDHITIFAVTHNSRRPDYWIKRVKE